MKDKNGLPTILKGSQFFEKKLHSSKPKVRSWFDKNVKGGRFFVIGGEIGYCLPQGAENDRSIEDFGFTVAEISSKICEGFYFDIEPNAGGLNLVRLEQSKLYDISKLVGFDVEDLEENRKDTADNASSILACAAYQVLHLLAEHAGNLELAKEFHKKMLLIKKEISDFEMR